MCDIMATGGGWICCWFACFTVYYSWESRKLTSINMQQRNLTVHERIALGTTSDLQSVPGKHRWYNRDPCPPPPPPHPCGRSVIVHFLSEGILYNNSCAVPATLWVLADRLMLWRHERVWLRSELETLTIWRDADGMLAQQRAASCSLDGNIDKLRFYRQSNFPNRYNPVWQQSGKQLV